MKTAISKRTAKQSCRLVGAGIGAAGCLFGCGSSSSNPTAVLARDWHARGGAYFAGSVVRGEAPGAPGAKPAWPPARKSFLGTSASDTSRVYFTGQRGTVSEVYYPLLDTVQTVDLQFLVGDAAGTYVDEESEADYSARRPDPRSLRWQVVTSNAAHGWRIVKEVFVDPQRDALILRASLHALGGRHVSDFRLYVSHDPALGDTGGGDSSHTVTAGGRTLLVASEGENVSALGVSAPWVTSADGAAMVSSGFVGSSDGKTDLLGGDRDHGMSWAYASAIGGNVAQLGWIGAGRGGADTLHVDVVLGFGATENDALDTTSATLGSDLRALADSYDAEWEAYTGSLDDQAGTADDQYYLSAMTLKASEDKSSGALVAGLGTPWGPTRGDDDNGGYHLVWARDLYKFANALITAGDLATARRAVEYLFGTLVQTTDCGESETAYADCPRGYSRVGRFPQNARIDGTPFWTSTQLDEQAMPILLAWRVYEQGTPEVQAEIRALWPRIRSTAEFILSRGPWTNEERWEETSGYSPSTIAAEIAGLVAAAQFAVSSGEQADADRYLVAADDWQKNVSKWTFTHTGPYGNHAYYERLNPSLPVANGTGLERFEPEAGPDAPLTISIGNGGGVHDQREILDGGFLELVRMGVKAANDPSILDSLPEYDAGLKQSIPGKGDAWFRYSFDGYGERNDGGPWDGQNGRGRLWPIFTAERGMYEIARSGSGTSGAPALGMLRAFSTPEGFIPEQVWNQSFSVGDWQNLTPEPYVPGTPTYSIAPLNWAMGEYISLLAAVRQNAVVDIPKIVCQRYETCAAVASDGGVASDIPVAAPGD